MLKLKQDADAPSLHDWYLMQLTKEVKLNTLHQGQLKNWDKLAQKLEKLPLSDFKLTLGTDTPKEEPDNSLHTDPNTPPPEFFLWASMLGADISELTGNNSLSSSPDSDNGNGNSGRD